MDGRGRAAAADRFDVTAAPEATGRAAFASDIRRGLTGCPKSLACRYFYDAEGSRLFEAICELPEYYVTRAEREILEDRVESIAERAQGVRTLAELGSGSAVKTRLLIDAFAARTQALRYVPIDISRSALEESARPLLAAHRQLEVRAVSGEYAEGLALLPTLCRPPTLLLWLGSNVGNLSREEARVFLATVHTCLGPEHRVLLGVDLRKDASVLEKAYDDAEGVTARFNKNLLARINRELGGDFDLDAFAHRARYEEEAGRVVMELVSQRRQRVRIEGLELALDFLPGEAIHTESSYKYDPQEIDALAEGAGYRTDRRWLDSGERFALNLLTRQDAPRSR